MATPDNYDALKKISSIEEKDQAAQPITKTLSPDQQVAFENFLDQKKVPNQQVADRVAVEKSEKQSLYDPNANFAKSDPLHTKEELIAQADKINAQIETVKQALAAEDVAIKPGYKTKLGNKLNHINESLRIAMDKINSPEVQASTTPAVDGSAGVVNPVQKFLGQMTHAQFQMESIRNYLTSMNENQSRLTPGNLIAIQLKVYGVQQEIELFTNMLNKALESTKTIMNVQV